MIQTLYVLIILGGGLWRMFNKPLPQQNIN